MYALISSMPYLIFLVHFCVPDTVLGTGDTAQTEYLLSGSFQSADCEPYHRVTHPEGKQPERIHSPEAFPKGIKPT